MRLKTPQPMFPPAPPCLGKKEPRVLDELMSKENKAKCQLAMTLVFIHSVAASCIFLLVNWVPGRREQGM